MDLGKPLHVLVASDSFKGSASSSRINDLIEEGVRRVCPDAIVRKVPVADGGEGTVEAMVSACRGTVRNVQVHGPLGKTVDASYGLVDGGPEGDPTAVIEMAAAAGLSLSDRSGRSALDADTTGVGELILDALDHGARRVCVGLGGSATSDGGSGMARALGARLLDESGREVPPGVAGLARLVSIDMSGLDRRLQDVEFLGLTDVTNPLSGPSGAVMVYGPQKGIRRCDLSEADGWMARYGKLLDKATGSDVSHLSGAGAAGGLGAGLSAFCGARLVSGIDFVLDAVHLDDALAGCDLAITGEGRMDSQTANGKTPVGVARRCARVHVPVIAVVGSRADDLGGIYDRGIGLVLPALTSPMSLEECMARVDVNVPLAAETATRAFLLGRPNGGEGNLT